MQLNEITGEGRNHPIIVFVALHGSRKFANSDTLVVAGHYTNVHETRRSFQLIV